MTKTTKFEQKSIYETKKRENAYGELVDFTLETRIQLHEDNTVYVTYWSNGISVKSGWTDGTKHHKKLLEAAGF